MLNTDTLGRAARCHGNRGETFIVGRRGEVVMSRERILTGNGQHLVFTNYCEGPAQRVPRADMEDPENSQHSFCVEERRRDDERRGDGEKGTKDDTEAERRKREERKIKR